MNQNQTTESSYQKYNEYLKKHPLVLVVLSYLAIVILIIAISSGSNKKDSISTDQPQTFEDRIKALTSSTGSSSISYNGIDNKQADSSKPAESRMVIVKFNVTSYYNENSFLGDSGKLSSKVIQESFNSNSNISDVIVWYYGDTKDKYGNIKNSLILSQGIDRATYQKVNWKNFDNSTLCSFLKSEGGMNGGETTCVILSNL